MNAKERECCLIIAANIADHLDALKRMGGAASTSRGLLPETRSGVGQSDPLISYEGYTGNYDGFTLEIDERFAADLDSAVERMTTDFETAASYATTEGEKTALMWDMAYLSGDWRGTLRRLKMVEAQSKEFRDCQNTHDRSVLESM